MKKYIALVLLLSFIGLLWAQEDTCLQNDDEAVDVEEGTSDEQIGDIRYADLLQLTSKPSFIYTQDYSISDQDSTDTPNSNDWKWYHTCCCLCTVVGLFATLAFIAMLESMSHSFPGG
jgi:hypothetical protein